MADVFGKINVLGLGSGLDLQGLLDKLREIEERPIERLEAKKDYYESRLTEFDWLNTKILSLKSKALDLSLESNYLVREVSVSGSSVTAEAEVGALEGTYHFDVTQLARKSLWQSQGFASQDAVLNPDADDVFQLEMGDQSFSLLVPQGTTLEGLARLINEAEDNPGVEAQVVDTGSPSDPYRLVIKAKETGEAHRIVVTQELEGVSFEEVTGVPNIWRTDSFSSPDAVINDSGGNITLTVNVGTQEISVDVPDGTTLSELKDLINEQTENSSLKAYLIRDAAGNYFLDLRSPEALNVTQDPTSPTLFPNQVENNGESLNAFFTLDEISYQRGSNEIQDLIPGLTIRLQNTGESSVTVSSSYEEIKEIFSSFVEEVNGFLSELREKMAVDLETGEEGPLYRSNAAESIVRDLRDVLSMSVPGNEHLTSLFDLGLDFNRDGSITLDQKKLEEAFSSYPEEVKRLMIGDEEENISGIAERLNNTLQKYLGTSGLIALEQDTTERYIENINRNISLAKERVDRYIANLQRQFMALDQYIQELNDMSSYLDVQFKSIMGLTENK